MAENKRKRSPKRHTRRILRFPEVNGKIIETVEIDDEVSAISIVFQDKTILSFDLDPILAVFPELSDHRSGDWRPIKRWPAMRSSPSMAKWP